MLQGRAWMRWIALGLALGGCEARVYDHGGGRASHRSETDAGSMATTATDCTALPDGTPCDDRDVCTPGSVCRDGTCFGANPYETCDIADTVDDFSGTQGEGGWWYGTWYAEADPDGAYDPDTDFEPMEFCGVREWMPPGGCATLDAPDRKWTQNLSHGLQHPEVDPLEIPVRRWVSDVSGEATITVDHHQNEGQVGDGTLALLYVDGEELWRNVATGDGIAGTAALRVTLEEGMRVEQLMHPRDDQADDTTYFAIHVGP